MAAADDRHDARRGVLKNLAAAGLGAAIATVAARELPPGLGGPATGGPSVSGPGTLDAVFNVRDQGAVGDGAADDTGALIGTIERVPASGGLVYLPRGTYRVTSPIVLGRTNVWVFGSGPDATVIRLGDAVNADVLTIRASGCTASNLTIDGNKAHNASGTGVLVDAAAASEMIENVTVRDLHVVRTKGAGIKGHSTPSGPANRRSLIQSCAAGIEVADGVDDVLIEGNTINGAGVGALAVNRYGIYVGGSLAASSKGSIRGNTVTRATANGIQAAGLGPSARASSLVLEGNLCYANGENGIYLRAVDNFVVEGNACFDNGTSGTEKAAIRLEGAWDGIGVGDH